MKPYSPKVVNQAAPVGCRVRGLAARGKAVNQGAT